MNQRNLTVLTDVVLITCIVQRGLADAIVKAAREAGAQGATVYYARGTGVRERLGILGVAVEVEKEIINVVVASDQVDYVFDKMFLAGKLDTPGMGFIYCSQLEKAATYIPPALVEKLKASSKNEKEHSTHSNKKAA
ncbi:MAG: P-II family nitrogen regulator [Bdellovibrionales bacterium]|nr:P-II family nitrogen regulator [Bdellovibrionales bacterium]